MDTKSARADHTKQQAAVIKSNAQNKGGECLVLGKFNEKAGQNIQGYDEFFTNLFYFGNHIKLVFM